MKLQGLEQMASQVDIWLGEKTGMESVEIFDRFVIEDQPTIDNVVRDITNDVDGIHRRATLLHLLNSNNDFYKEEKECNIQQINRLRRIFFNDLYTMDIVLNNSDKVNNVKFHSRVIDGKDGVKLAGSLNKEYTFDDVFTIDARINENLNKTKLLVIFRFKVWVYMNSTILDLKEINEIAKRICNEVRFL